MSSKDEILANFQACTGISDYGEAFTCLETANWDLVEAINKAIPEQPQEMREHEGTNAVVQRVFDANMYSSSFSLPVEQQGEVIDIDTPEETLAPTASFSSQVGVSSLAQSSSSASSSLPSVLDINIQVLCDGASDGSSFPLELPGSTTVGELQTILHQLVGIPPCNQILEGFEKSVDPTTVITPNLLPKSMSLTLNASSSSFSNIYTRHNGTVSDNYHLLIHDEKSGKDHKLNYPGSKLIRELKTELFYLTNIAERNQLWSGWPADIDENNTTLASSGISKEHHLTVSQQPVVERTPRTQRKITAKNLGEASEENSSADEFEDASSELIHEDDFLIMCDVPSTQRTQALIPANVESEITGVTNFIKEFQNRFGHCIPLFFQGTLESALKESVMLPAKTRKLLAVYLHHDGSVLSNVFCSQALCHLSVVDYLTNNYVIWGWDLTHESNKARLLNLVSSHFGTMAASTIRSFSVEKLPALLIITRSRGSIEVLSVIHGNSVLDEVMTSLLHASEMYDEQRRSEVLEEDAREQRETMKAEQDAAYHASLEADRAKVEAKRRAELEERVEKERQQSIREHEEAIKEAVRASLEMDLPEEPGADCEFPTTVLRFRVPNADPFKRTFTLHTPLKVVLNYLCVRGYPADEYKHLQAWPRRDISSLDSSKTLEELKFPNQETLTIEERLEGEIN